jgi:hypothetical protein
MGHTKKILKKKKKKKETYEQIYFFISSIYQGKDRYTNKTNEYSEFDKNKQCRTLGDDCGQD